MTAFRAISLGVHGALELTLGLALMASPFVFVSGPPPASRPWPSARSSWDSPWRPPTLDERGSIAAHHAFDWGAVLGLAGAGIPFAIVGEVAAGTTFVAVALALTLLSLTTRYSLAR